jgi:hypothetical protein
MNWLFFLTASIFSLTLLWTAFELFHFAIDPVINPNSHSI